MKINVRAGNQLVQVQFQKTSNKKLTVRFKHNKEIIKEIKSYEGASWDPETKTWTVADSERNLYCINYLEGWVDPRYSNSIKYSIIWSDKRDHYKHQKEIVEIILERKRWVCAGDPGVGKTAPLIEAMERLGGYTMIVCPKTAKYAWNSELKRLKSTLRLYDGRKGKPSYSLITYNKLYNFVGRANNLQHWPDNIIFDECHLVKNPNSQRGEAALILAAWVRARDGFIVPMSGTPDPHDPSDWWMLCELCQPGHLRESTKQKLLYRIAVKDDRFDDFFKVDHYNLDEIAKLHRRMGNMVGFYRKKDCLDLPDKIYKRVVFPAAPDTLKAAELIKDTSPRAITALIRLRQFSDGFIKGKKCAGCEGDGYLSIERDKQSCPACDGAGQIAGGEFDTPKDEAIREALNEDRNRLIIFAGFTQSIDKLVRIAKSENWKTIRLDGRGVESEFQDPIDEFQSDNPAKLVYIGHPRAGGISITLTKSDTVIYYSNDFDGAARPQSEDRVHRPGTKTSPLIIDYLWLPSDTVVLENLMGKRSLQALTMDDLNTQWKKEQ